jgi:hypothetical protein
MGKFGTGEIFGNGLLYGVDPQYLLGVGALPSATALGMPTINPGPVTIQGVGNITSGEVLGTLWCLLIPQKLVLSVNTRHLSVAPQIRRLQVTANG